MEERRREKRYVATFPVVVESQDRYFFVSQAKNVATTGALVMMAAKLEVGEPVNITYNPESAQSQDYDIKGKIVRVEDNIGNRSEEWPYLAAIEFTGPLPHIVEILGKPEEDE